MYKDSSISPTVLITVHSPLGKVKVLALLDTSSDANFIKKDLADTLRLPLYGSLDFKVKNSTYTDASSITQPVTFDLEGSPFCVKCNSTPNLSYPFILGFPWLKECFLNFDHINNRVTFTCNDALCFAPLNNNLSLSSPAFFQLTLLAASHNELIMHINSDRIPLCYSNFKDCFSKNECHSLPPHCSLEKIDSSL
ncbi:retrotransposon-like protein 1 [Entomophthora muscae]|uniref:Retrotransposon-like protein 1 n=1 Tax=Entomophthora muscae TaxID=34485 RepID=A0ACC2UMS9_9FUNG|nr:retrotransposon-like protein 1 [Entomophthora muscae]